MGTLFDVGCAVVFHGLRSAPSISAVTGVSCRVVGGHVLDLASRALRRTIIARHRLVDQKGRVPASWAIAQAEGQAVGGVLPGTDTDRLRHIGRHFRSWFAITYIYL
jgi:hypothetical protein